LGRAGNLWIALGIATLKATLVALYFMHLRYERPFNAVVLVCALLFVMLFCSLVLMDTRAYQPDIQAYRDVDPVNYAPDLQRP
jgi:cytochrome c oxidase subunit 4